MAQSYFANSYSTRDRNIIFFLILFIENGFIPEISGYSFTVSLFQNVPDINNVRRFVLKASRL